MSVLVTQKLDIIAAQRTKVEEAQRAVDVALRVLDLEKAKLTGMELMAESFAGAVQIPPASHFQSAVPYATPLNADNRSKLKGRQPGAISRQWRDTLHFLYMNYPGGFTEHSAAVAANEAGLPNVRARDALERMRAYIPLGYVVPSGDRFVVSEQAARRYGFTREKREASTSEPMEAP